MTIEHDVTNYEYHNLREGYSSSFIKKAHLESLAHAAEGSSSISQAIADFGSAVHAMTLEPEKDLVIEGPENRRGNAWKDAQESADAAGKILLPEKEFWVAHAAAKSVLEHPVAGTILKAKDKICEASIFVTHPRTGLKLKIRPDIYIPSMRTMADVKTTQSSEPKKFTRQAWSMGWVIQAAFYQMCAELAEWEVDHFLFLSVEKVPPYAAHAHHVSQQAMDRGLAIVEHTLDKIAEAERTGVWGLGWGDRSMLDVPAWMQPEDDADE